MAPRARAREAGRARRRIADPLRRALAAWPSCLLRWSRGGAARRRLRGRAHSSAPGATARRSPSSRACRWSCRRRPWPRRRPAARCCAAPAASCASWPRRWASSSSPAASAPSAPWTTSPGCPSAATTSCGSTCRGTGGSGHEMMKRTATVQVNLDFADEADAADKMRTAIGRDLDRDRAVTPPRRSARARPTATRATGRRSGWTWTRTAVACCRSSSSPGFGFRALRRVGRWTCRCSSWRAAGSYHPLDGRHLPPLPARGLAGRAGHHGDWALHLSTLFPEVRLKRTIELRGADAAPAALRRGAGRRCGAACSTIPRRARRPGRWWPGPPSPSARRCAARCRAPAWRRSLGGRTAAPSWPSSCARSPRAGLGRLPGGADDRPLLEPLLDYAQAGPLPADDMLADFQPPGGDPARLVEAWELDPGEEPDVELAVEVPPGFEPGNEGFADPCLTTWPRHRSSKRAWCTTIRRAGHGDQIVSASRRPPRRARVGAPDAQVARRHVELQELEHAVSSTLFHRAWASSLRPSASRRIAS